jgi:hypothetical protein
LNLFVDLPTFVHFSQPEQLFPGGILMKRILLILLLMVLVSSVFAQQEEEQPIPPKRSKAARVGAFGGFIPGLLFVDVKPINDFLVASGGAALNDGGVFLYGGGGAAYIMLVSNLRVGGLGMSGSIKSTSLNAQKVRRDAELHVGFGGVTVEYVVPLSERLDVAFGGMVGGGGIDITLRQDVGGAKTWGQEWVNFGSGNYQTGVQISHIKQTMSGSFLVWIPSVNVEYAIVGWLGVRLGASYVGMSLPSWTIDDDHDLLGVPTSINGKGFMINAGVFVGTF